MAEPSLCFENAPIKLHSQEIRPTQQHSLVRATSPEQRGPVPILRCPNSEFRLLIRLANAEPEAA